MRTDPYYSSPAQRSRPGAVLLLVLAAAIFFPLLWYQSSVVLSVLDARQHYVKTTATVQVSEIRTGHHQKGGDYPIPTIDYQFTVGGREFHGQRFRFGSMDEDYNGSWTAAMIDLHPVGSSLVIWYDPAHPAESVIDLGWQRWYRLCWLVLVALAGVMVTALLFTITALRDEERSRQCLLGTWAPGWTIPGLGAVTKWARGTMIGGGRTPFARAQGFGIGFAVTCLSGITMLFFSARADHPDASPAQVIGFVVLAVAVGTIVMVMAGRRFVRTCLRLDAAHHRVEFTSRELHAVIAWSDIIGWRVIEDRRNDDQEYILVLESRNRDLVTVYTWAERWVPEHLAKELARATEI
jgi:hypothetical protein